MSKPEQAHAIETMLPEERRYPPPWPDPWDAVRLV
jgi:hypothetical protein